MKIIYKDGHVDECPQDQELHVIRHTAAHILAQAVKRRRFVKQIFCRDAPYVEAGAAEVFSLEKADRLPGARKPCGGGVPSGAAAYNDHIKFFHSVPQMSMRAGSPRRALSSLMSESAVLLSHTRTSKAALTAAAELSEEAETRAFRLTVTRMSEKHSKYTAASAITCATLRQTSAR